MDFVEEWSPLVDLTVNYVAPRAQQCDKEDYRQECFLALLQEQKRYQKAIDKRAWVMTVCRHTLLNLLDKKLRRPEESLEAAANVTHDPLKIDNATLEDAISKLSREEQYIVRQAYYIGNKDADIAIFVNRSRSCVTELRQAALEKMKEMLE